MSLSTSAFGPLPRNSFLDSKELTEDNIKYDRKVSFGGSTKVIIVENWKKFNVDVSSREYKEK